MRKRPGSSSKGLSLILGLGGGGAGEIVLSGLREGQDDDQWQDRESHTDTLPLRRSPGDNAKNVGENRPVPIDRLFEWVGDTPEQVQVAWEKPRAGPGRFLIENSGAEVTPEYATDRSSHFEPRVPGVRARSLSPSLGVSLRSVPDREADRERRGLHGGLRVLGRRQR